MAVINLTGLNNDNSLDAVAYKSNWLNGHYHIAYVDNHHNTIGTDEFTDFNSMFEVWVSCRNHHFNRVVFDGAEFEKMAKASPESLR